MNAKDAIRQASGLGTNLVTAALGDLTDAELLIRPAPNANHIAWQIGHLIESQAKFHNDLPGVTTVELPKGFAEKHAKETSTVDTPSAFYTKAEYLALFEKVQSATLKALDSLPDSALETPTKGPMASFAPTLGAMFVVMATHPIMHMGQFSVLRRKLGKPVLF